MANEISAAAEAVIVLTPKSRGAALMASLGTPTTVGRWYRQQVSAATWNGLSDAQRAAALQLHDGRFTNLRTRPADLLRAHRGRIPPDNP